MHAYYENQLKSSLLIAGLLSVPALSSSIFISSAVAQESNLETIDGAIAAPTIIHEDSFITAEIGSDGHTGSEGAIAAPENISSPEANNEDTLSNEGFDSFSSLTLFGDQTLDNQTNSVAFTNTPEYSTDARDLLNNPHPWNLRDAGFDEAEFEGAGLDSHLWNLNEAGVDINTTQIAQMPGIPGVFVVPPGNGETIADIQVRYFERSGLETDDFYEERIILREVDLEPGDTYDPILAEESLRQIFNLPSVADVNLVLEYPEEGQVVMIFDVFEGTPGIAFGRHFALIPGADAIRPNALQGTTVAPVVRPGPPRQTGFLLPFSLQYFNIGGTDRTLTFGIKPGDETLGFDLTYRDPWIFESESRLGLGLNVFALSFKDPNFQRGPNNIDLSSGSDPWENRFGGGFQFFRPTFFDFEGAVGMTYQRISFSDSVYGSERFTEDEDGNPLTVSGDDTDELLMLTINTLYDRRNNPLFPTSGNRVQIGIDQAIPIGEANTFFTRIGANYTQFIPIDLIRVPETPGTLVLNAQGGTIPFDAPPGYEAYVLGGSSSVRGYGAGEVGSPRNFVQGSIEYRFPFASIDIGNGFFREILGDTWIIGGNVFFDAATGFDSDDTVIGSPGEVRGKPGEGYGYGAGILTSSPAGLVRLEFGITGGGDTAFIFAIGDRF